MSRTEPVTRHHLRLCASDTDVPDFSWSIETEEDGRDVTLIRVPRVPAVLEALRQFRSDLRLREMAGDHLTFEVLDAACPCRARETGLTRTTQLPTAIAPVTGCWHTGRAQNDA